jgi:hypothetical protein
MKRREANLTKRFEMRCSPADYRRWDRRAKTLGMPSVATFLRVAANEAIAKERNQSKVSP